MSQTPALVDTSFGDAIAIIAASDELSKQTQLHWTTSLRQIAKALDKPLGVIPARLNAVRADLARLHHVPAGLTPKTLQNHKSNVRSALRWLAREKGIPRHGAPLTPAWEGLRAEIKDRFVSLAVVVVYPVLLRERDCAGRGGRAHPRALQGLSGAVRDACRRPIRAAAGPSVEFECRNYPGLAGAPANGAGGEAHHGARLGGVSRGLSAGC